ncbi:MAG: hypothetical protein WAK69_03800 [Rhodoplanes sp.]
MSQALDIKTEVALRIRRAVRSGRLVGAIWYELYRLDRDAVIGVPVAEVAETDALVDRALVKERRERDHGGSTLGWRVQASAIGRRACDLVRTWAKRADKRRELIDYVAQDHRAAADMGTTGADAKFWAQRPFWRA